MIIASAAGQDVVIQDITEAATDHLAVDPVDTQKVGTTESQVETRKIGADVIDNRETERDTVKITVLLPQVHHRLLRHLQVLHHPQNQ